MANVLRSNAESGPGKTPQNPAENAKEGGPDRIQKQIRVLYVEDREQLRKMFVRILGKTGASISTADGYKSALKILENDTKFDAVVLDVELENEPSGVDLYWKLPEELRGKVFFFSGGCEEKELRGIEAIGRPLIDKTTGGSELVAIIKEIASQSS